MSVEPGCLPVKGGATGVGAGGDPTSSSQLSSGTKSVINLTVLEDPFVAGLEPVKPRNIHLQS